MPRYVGFSIFLTYRIEYLRGPLNTGADALSRRPVVPVRPLMNVGLESQVRSLLDHLDGYPLVKESPKVWFWSGSDTTDEAR